MTRKNRTAIKQQQAIMSASPTLVLFVPFSLSLIFFAYHVPLFLCSCKRRCMCMPGTKQYIYICIHPHECCVSVVSFVRLYSHARSRVLSSFSHFSFPSMSTLTNCTYSSLPWCEGHRTRIRPYTTMTVITLQFSCVFSFFLSLYPFGFFSLYSLNESPRTIWPAHLYMQRNEEKKWPGNRRNLSKKCRQAQEENLHTHILVNKTYKSNNHKISIQIWLGMKTSSKFSPATCLIVNRVFFFSFQKRRPRQFFEPQWHVTWRSGSSSQL